MKLFSKQRYDLNLFVPEHAPNMGEIHYTRCVFGDEKVKEASQATGCYRKVCEIFFADLKVMGVTTKTHKFGTYSE